MMLVEPKLCYVDPSPDNVCHVKTLICLLTWFGMISLVLICYNTVMAIDQSRVNALLVYLYARGQQNNVEILRLVTHGAGRRIYHSHNTSMMLDN